MNTKINLTYKDVPYVLEYSRESIRALEKSGLSIEDFLAKPMSNIELAFAGAFIKNHRKIKSELVEEIFASCKGKDKLVAALVQMIQESYESLFEEPTGDEGNADWEVVDLSPKKVQK